MAEGYGEARVPIMSNDYVVAGPAASVTLRNGTGANDEVLQTVTTPVLGSDWDATVDVGSHPGATFSFILGFGAPLPPVTLSFGELLVDVSTPQDLTSSAVSAGGLDLHSNAVPDDLTLLGFELFTQGAILGGGVELSNALDLVIGF